MAKNGVVWDKFGVFLEQFGVILDKFGVVWAQFGNKKTPQNRTYNTINAENTKFSHLISLNTPHLHQFVGVLEEFFNEVQKLGGFSQNRHADIDAVG
jgi:hypothetical protein